MVKQIKALSAKGLQLSQRHQPNDLIHLEFVTVLPGLCGLSDCCLNDSAIGTRECGLGSENGGILLRSGREFFHPPALYSTAGWNLRS
jgi:hypothetical protein